LRKSVRIALDQGSQDVFTAHVREWGRQLAPLVLLITAACAATAPGALAAPAGTTHYPDLQTVIPTNSFSVVNGTDGREFRYTHLVYNAGPGPLQIQPQYNEASGSYQGQQRLYTHNASNQWSLASSVRVPDAFVFHAAHGHFHFPLAAFGLYAVAADGGIGAPVTVSPKNGFCISDSYIYDSTVVHAGTFIGSQGSCADPTTMRGLTVGGADEYDYRDPGQSIPFAGVPDGTYWFRAMSDPNNDFAEANEANNETDVKVTIAGSTVTAGQVVRPDTTPPTITWGAPADGARVLGNVTLSASSPAAGGGGVQFLVDGNVVGSATSSPYSLSWNSTTVVDGDHWVSARTTDAQGRTNTTTPVVLAVTNSTPPPVPGLLGIDSSKSVDGRSTVTTPALGTTQTGDLLVAFVASDGPSGQTATVSGGGLTWSLVRRANTRPGTAEIWKATAPGSAAGVTVTSTQSRTGYEQSLTVIAFAGAGGVGASSAAGATTGAPRTTLTTTVGGSWVFGTGNDWDGATARTLGAGQTVRHQWVDTGPGDTFWAQSQTSSTANAGTIVAIDDTAPTNHQWNLAAVEVLPGSQTPPPQDTTAPQVTVTDPKPATTVSGIVALGATASDNVGVTRVQFKVDGQSVGGPITSPPFQAQWDTRTASAGSHTVTAEASDAAGYTATSAGVTVTVDNSAPPPATIGIDRLVVRHARGTLTSPALTTPTAGDAVLAFVSFDGPSGAGGQSATVTGAGLTWTLVKRSNTQPGTSEIWSAKATGTLTNATVTATPQRSGFDGSLTVVAFRNASGTGVAGAAGATTGAPDIYLPGIGTGSWVWAVGNDWDRAVARTPVTGQQLQDQWIDTGMGATFWVQSTGAPNTASGLVTIHDNAPTNDRWNYAAVEITPVAGTATATIALGAAPAAQRATTAVGYYCTLHQPAAVTL
jgi:Big-like domain-containing protein/lysyl oxidase